MRPRSEGAKNESPIIREYARLALQYDNRWSRYVEASVRETVRRLAFKPTESLWKRTTRTHRPAPSMRRLRDAAAAFCEHGLSRAGPLAKLLCASLGRPQGDRERPGPRGAMRHLSRVALAQTLPNPGGVTAAALKVAAENDAPLGEIREVCRLFQHLLPGLVINVAFFREQLTRS